MTECAECDEPTDNKPSDEAGNVFCTQECANRHYERAYDRAMERFYGGDTPQTLDEQHMAAWKQKRDLR